MTPAAVAYVATSPRAWRAGALVVGAFVLLLCCMMVGIGGTVESHVGPRGRFLPGRTGALGLDAAQLAQASRALTVADSIRATTPLARLAMVCSALGESGFRPVLNGGGSGYAGVFQADPANIPMDDTEEQARSFLLGGKGFQAGGAISLSRLDPPLTPGTIATLVEASGEPGSFYDVHRPQAERIIAAWEEGSGSFPSPAGDATAEDVLRDTAITMTPGQRADLRSGGIDARLLSALEWITGRGHTVTITALRHDHGTDTAAGYRSNHADGRAMDLGVVDGQACNARWGAPPDPSNRCGRLAHDLAQLGPPVRPTELIWCWDVDGPADSRSFALADHCDHVHVGWDAGSPR